jgi:protein phosphatase
MPDIYVGAVRHNDLFLLASDGLSGMLEDYELAEVLAAGTTPQRMVDNMIAAANQHGGLDNITAIVVRIDAVDAPLTDENPTLPN